MKKIMSIMFSVLLALSVSITAFAAEDTATPDSADLELQIKQDANEYFYDGSQELDNIIITYYGSLSDGSLIVNVDRDDVGHPTVSYTHTVGDYYYMYTAGQEAYIYKNNTFTFIEDAYANGLINDDTLIEVAECSKQYLENPYDVNYYFVFVSKFGESGLDYFLEEEIKQDANEYFYDGNANVDDINVVHYGTLSDGSPVVNIYRYGGAATVTYSYILGNYEYHCHAGDEAYIYKNNTFYFIVDAYESGLINDDTLDELYNCSVEYLKNPVDGSYFLMYPIEVETTTQAVEATTQPTETTAPDATSSTEAESTTATNGTKPASTSDTATAKSSNNAVQTGQSSFAILTTLLVIALSGAVVVFAKHGYNK